MAARLNRDHGSGHLVLDPVLASGLALGSHSSARAQCGGRLQKVPAVAFRHSRRVAVAEPVCGSQEEVRTYSPAHMMSDLVLGK